MSNLIPVGNYPAVAVRVAGDDGNFLARFARSSTGSGQVLVYFEFLAGPHAGARLPWFGFFTKDSHVRTLESLRLLGWTGDDVMAINSQACDQEVSITVEHNEYEGKIHARVAWVNRPGGGVITLKNPMTIDELRKFSASVKRVAVTIPAVAGKRVTPEGAQAPAASSAAPSRAAEPPRNDDWDDRSRDHNPGAGPPDRQPGEDDIPF